jgi:hypothetical protein
MLDLGSDINILPKKTWEAMGKPMLDYSPIQLCMANQYCIYPVGRLENIKVDIAGVKTMEYFEVIEIMGEKDPYPTFLGIDWAYDNYAIIDLKKELMIFEADGVKFIQPLDPYEGPRYTEPSNENMEPDILDQLYTVTIGKWVDYINPTTDGSVSWQKYSICGRGLRGNFENWQHGWYEKFSRCCATIRVSRWIGTELREHLVYDGVSELHKFLVEMEEKVGIDQEYRL